jgi:hypothetical protein
LFSTGADGNGLAGLQEAMRQHFDSAIIPAFEKAVQIMFDQMRYANPSTQAKQKRGRIY